MKKFDPMNLNPGDMVAVTNTFGRGHSLAVVERLTATQIITKAGARYRRSDGSRITSDRWHSNRLVELTPEIRLEVENSQLNEFIKGISPSNLTVDQKRAIKAIAEATT